MISKLYNNLRNWLFGPKPKTPLGPKPKTPQDEVVDLVCLCIKNDSGAWVKGENVWEHSGLNFSIWFGRVGASYVELSVQGYVLTSPQIPLTHPQKIRLWDAHKNPQKGHSEQQQRDQAEEIILRVMTYYEKQGPQSAKASA